MTTKPKGRLYAIKTRRTKANGWMPEVCAVRLEGASGDGGVFLVCGWSIQSIDEWPISRIKAQLSRIERQWFDEYGKGWRLEIR